ncbi:MAG: nucleoside deaminase [Eggerthellaceae bacterium]|jgi:tRNA(adenine34) deaminase|nr:nucleoside deaminase [Eggerthellaceae bacterium]
MQLALAQARKAASLDEVPIGAVVVCGDTVLSEACNLRESTNDPAGHAEFLALREAAERLGAWRLSGCTVYVTLEPCVMCAGLMHQARVERCVYGAPDPKAGALGTLYSIHADERLNHVFKVSAGVCQEECSSLLSGFFADKRKKKP